MYKSYQAKSFSGMLCWPPSCQERFAEQLNQFSLTFPFLFLQGNCLHGIYVYAVLSISASSYLKEHGTKTVVEILVLLKSMKIFPWFQKCQNFTVMRMVVPYYHRSVQGVKLNPHSSKQNQTTCFVWQVLHFPFYQGNCRQFCSREQDVLCLLHEQRSECWSSAVTHIQQCVFVTSERHYPPCSAPQKHFKWCGRYFIWWGKALLYVSHKDLIIILSFIQITL